MAKATPPSPLLLQEYFSTQDPRFLSYLFEFREDAVLAKFVEQWKRDSRPWAREQIFEYLKHPLSHPGHEPVVKRLFKHAQAERDDELAGAFMIAFDKLVRRHIGRGRRWVEEVRRYVDVDRLYTTTEQIPGPRLPYDWRGRKTLAPGAKPKFARPVAASELTWLSKDALLFSRETKHYLRRRAWRYFRRMAHKEPERYLAAMVDTLARYTDDDLDDGIAIMDAWGLAHACFHHSGVLRFDKAIVRLVPGQSLVNLTAAPYREELWQAPETAPKLFDLITRAGATVVKLFAIELLSRHHMDRLRDVTPQQLLRLLDDPSDQVQHFAAQLLERIGGLENLPVSAWLVMLRTRNLAALELIAKAVRRHVTAERVTVDQAVDLASAAPTPVAQLGLELLRQKNPRTAAELQSLTRLAAARSPMLAGEIATFALSAIAASYSADLATPFFDSLSADIRRAAWEWLAPGSPAWPDPLLHARLLESPYDDIRLPLIDSLQGRSKLPGLSPADLTSLWTGALLNIHRGGRHKLKALSQLTAATVENPTLAPTLLPLIGIALRSVRAPEMRHALAAIVRLLDDHPDLAAAVQEHLPELTLSPEEAV
jgi:hypothetical protein